MKNNAKLKLLLVAAGLPSLLLFLLELLSSELQLPLELGVESSGLGHVFPALLFLLGLHRDGWMDGSIKSTERKKWEFVAAANKPCRQK